jgi:NAD(P)-dependent dehydrogenase (short-subunit alcohol dehydrogenase family)
VPFKSYAQSKLANLMTSVELHDRCQECSQQLNLDDSTAVTCTTVHPGLVDTPLARYYFENDYLKPAFLRPVLRPVIRVLFPLALLKPELSVANMDYAMFGDGVERKFVRSHRAIGVFGAARCKEATVRLWDTSLELAGMQNPF